MRQTKGAKLLVHWIVGVVLLFVFAGSAGAQQRAVQVAAVADDPFGEKQSYLQQIHVNEAWDVAKGNTNIIIAVVDTGVDLSHPDLQPNLINGINLISPKLLPRDDNGHGTNVAGVLAAATNNDKGVSGILWNAKIMPIKALESDGSGGEAKLGEGIRYAVDHGAKIVVLSLGLNKYSTYMSDIVKYAEDHDVLLVAATGNEGNRVKYPAAYPTVLAVGGMTAERTADNRSNTGPEVDLVAPWDVFTTALGGSYEYKDGTSMAAPQVAAVAALAWSKYPDFKAYQIRQLLRQTADDLGSPGWDASTGYGLLRADRALSEMPLLDMYEPNNRKDQAKPVSISKTISASFSGGSDQDWFAFDASYNGTVRITFQQESGQSITVQHTDASGAFTSQTVGPGEAAVLPVTKGRSYLQLQLGNRNFKGEAAYQMTTSFDIYRDPFEDNDKQYKASVLPSRSQTIKGTFHQQNDQDWFEFRVMQSGTLNIRLSTDTARIDPVLFVQKQGEKSVTIDDGEDGASENLQLSEVFPGSYYIKVSNVKEYPYPVTGEYYLTIEYDAKQIDPNEPNNRSYQATTVSLNTEYDGLMDKADDVDWFQFPLSGDSLVQVDVSDIPSGIEMGATLYDGSMRPITNSSSGYALQLRQRLGTGNYYLKLGASGAFDHHMYRLIVGVKPLVGGYADINGHWAMDNILAMSDKQVINGYDDYTFRPNHAITRAEATTLLSRALNLSKQKGIYYTDLAPDHWAYPYIARAAQSGIVDGYPDGSFAPDQPVSRMEMISMIAKGLNKTGKRRGANPFTDVDDNYWGTPILKQMKAEGWIDGYADGSFRPDQQASRAEFVSMLAKMLP
ncbi:S8 family peptidase [Paenibacillus rigui]|uniref:Peptidase S8 n=1 Tax=Paenibacillus rigui TaxID=554312 RepID=A0A229UST6_9BACL|nr:S8 family serine peptidase [Paenibacillus rigui]OXM86393.1 peptidase S8 [Paenibacillus rigui]